MTSATTAWQDLLRRLASSMNDTELANFLSVHGVRSDDDLADAIDIDGRSRDQENTTVDLHRYMTAIPELQERPVVLDTALEATLRSMRRAGIDQVQAVAILVEDYPRLAAPIRTCAMLDQCVAGTSTIAKGVTAAEPLTLPCGIGEVIEDGRPRYELRDVIGRGNQAIVYLSVDRRLSTSDSPAWVAIKVMQHHASEDELSMPSLGSEAHAARRVNHPNVVRVLDRGLTEDQREFVVYEYVRGMTLHEARNRRASVMAPDDAARLVVQIARGLQAAHNAAVLHCDLKPANVLLTDGGSPKIADFGLARHVQAEDLSDGPVGSFAFMSPEQFGADAEANMTTTDIYSLGGVLYWLLTDLPPNGSDAESVATRLRAGADAPAANPRAVRPELDEDLAAICSRAIHPRRKDRYASAEAFASDLEHYLERRPLAWTRPDLRRRVSLAYRRSPRAVVLICTSCVAAVGAVGSAAGIWHSSAVAAVEHRLALAQEKQARQEASQSAATEKVRVESAANMAQTWMTMLKSPKEGQFANWLQGTIVVETFFGDSLFEDMKSGHVKWPDRAEHARSAIQKAREEGRSDDFETRIWETMEGFWLIQAERYKEAATALAASEARWRALLSERDGMVEAVSALRAAAEYGMLKHDPEATPAALASALAAVQHHLAKPELQSQVVAVLKSVQSGM